MSCGRDKVQTSMNPLVIEGREVSLDHEFIL